MRNGAPFFIKGAAGFGYLKELRQAGANTIRVYDTTNLEKVLDEAALLDLAVVVDIPLDQYRPGFSYSDQYIRKINSKVAAVVDKYKDHPSLLYWNLGNEIKYPVYYETTRFVDLFNTLLRTIEEIDPNHPVSTTFAGTNRGRLNNIVLRSPGLDFLSFQTFGGLPRLADRLDDFFLLWEGPYVVSEWGINGPWEEEETSWGAPIEPTSTKKAEQLLQRASLPILSAPDCLGNFYFYWGNKHERTSTWFSTFTAAGERFQTLHALNKYWKENSTAYNGPELKYALLENEGSPSDIILPPGKQVEAEIFLKKMPAGTVDFTWTIRPEAWADDLEKQKAVEGVFLEQQPLFSSFTVPQKEGPYRLFYTVSDDKGNIAATNIPFYVLNPRDE